MELNLVLAVHPSVCMQEGKRGDQYKKELTRRGRKRQEGRGKAEGR
jgi:hypothetical protein